MKRNPEWGRTECGGPGPDAATRTETPGMAAEYLQGVTLCVRLPLFCVVWNHYVET